MSTQTIQAGKMDADLQELYNRAEGYMPQTEAIGRDVREAFREIRKAPASVRNAVLLEMEVLLSDTGNIKEILAANEQDLAQSESYNLSPALKERLTVNDKRLNSMRQALREIAAFPDPVGEVISGETIAGGVEMVKKRVPLGVVFCIYESRPNVTVDIGALCIKSGNGAVLRGGKEAIHTNRALHSLFVRALEKVGLPGGAVHLVGETDRAFMVSLLQQDKLLDLVVPRGGENMIRFISQNTRIPVVKHDKGVCNLYVDKAADLEQTIAIAINAKLQRPSVCNAIENIIIHNDFPQTKELLKRLKDAGVELLGDEPSLKILDSITPLQNPEEEYDAEFLDNRLAVKMTPDLDGALEFIHKYGSGHSEAIMSQDVEACEEFAAGVDTAAVFINCSTRFHDGGEMGMGAEVGISTGRLHVRGPMGVRDLTTTTYIMRGRGHVRK